MSVSDTKKEKTKLIESGSDSKKKVKRSKSFCAFLDHNYLYYRQEYEKRRTKGKLKRYEVEQEDYIKNIFKNSTKLDDN